MTTHEQTLREMEAELRDDTDAYRLTTNGNITVAEAIGAIAAILGRRCETCRHASTDMGGFRECYNDFDGIHHGSNMVPLLTPSGEPHGCASWQKKEA